MGTLSKKPAPATDALMVSLLCSPDENDLKKRTKVIDLLKKGL